MKCNFWRVNLTLLNYQRIILKIDCELLGEESESFHHHPQQPQLARAHRLHEQIVSVGCYFESAKGQTHLLALDLKDVLSRPGCKI